MNDSHQSSLFQIYPQFFLTLISPSLSNLDLPSELKDENAEAKVRVRRDYLIEKREELRKIFALNRFAITKF